MQKNSSQIKEKLALIPANPGVYLMKNGKDVVIYVGKAKVLKNRVRSYFNGKPSDMKTVELVKRIRDFDYIITNTELEALILENNLIKKYMPHYNILLKDDRGYPFIKVTIKDDFPRIIPVRNCNRNIIEGQNNDQPCINYQLGKCTAPCAGYISKGDYRKIINNFIRFIHGNNKKIIDELEKEMFELSSKMEFEKAAVIRDRIEAIKNMTKNQHVHFTDQKNRDIIGFYQEGSRAAVAILKILAGKLLNREIYPLANIEDSTYEEIIESFLKQYYLNKLDNLPHKIVLADKPNNFDELNDWLNNKLIIPRKGDNKKLLLIAKKNAFNFVEELKLKYLKRKNRTILPVQELKDKANLNKLPIKMVCFDISTIQGSDTVSSMVFFENGKPKKKNYRTFIMKTLTGQDDFAAMAETLDRYLERLKTDDELKPDLIVIDGGKGQLSSAYKILVEKGIDGIEMISLAKRIEEIFKPGNSESIILKKSSSALRMLIHLRDEAHRFAITFHRKRRSVRTLTSELDNIKGIGEEKKFLLLKHFGSVSAIKKASVEELSSLNGIAEKTAKHILDCLS